MYKACLSAGMSKKGQTASGKIRVLLALYTGDPADPAPPNYHAMLPTSDAHLSVHRDSHALTLVEVIASHTLPFLILARISHLQHKANFVIRLSMHKLHVAVQAAFLIEALRAAWLCALKDADALRH